MLLKEAKELSLEVLEYGPHISKKLEIPIAYRLLKKSSNWWIYDVVIDGISLVKNFRGQFSRIVKAKGFPGLLDKLRNKTEKTKAASK